MLCFLEEDDSAGGVDAAAAAGAAALDVSGLAVSLTATESGLEPVACSSDTARSFEDAQFTLGEGPGVNAARTGTVVCVGDLTNERPDRWPLLLRELMGLRVRSVFCFPMALGAIRIGVLSATRHTASRFTPEQMDDSLALAAALTTRYLATMDEVPDHADALDFPESLEHAVIHQATGMVSVQLELPLSQALLRLRAHAYSTGRPITDMAHDIVNRRLRLSPTGDSTPPSLPVKD
ncbi:ANTAR domain-containing protein [Streptomyces beijiangensis]